MDSGDESDDKPMCMEMLKDTCDGSKSLSTVNGREENYKIFDQIKRNQT